MIEQSMGDAVTLRAGASAALGRIDQYELVRELGGGGFGTVFLAHDTVADIDVAVKGLPPLVRNNREELENIRRNFALVSRLHHPHIAAALVLHPVKSASYAARVTAERLRVFEGDFLVVMEFAPGVTLSQWRKQFPDGKVPAAEAQEIVRQVADALDYAHIEKIIHRDVKPANVMIETKTDGSLVARVLDFGLAAEVRSSMGRVSQQVTDTSGTRPYMAPEQWLGKRQNAATDQYALAVLAYELLTGEVPFASVFDTGDPVVMMNVVGRETPELSGDLPRGMRKAFATALAKAPEARFGDCLTFAAALQGKRADGGAFAGRTLVAVSLAAVLATVGVCGWWMRKTQKDAEEARLAEVARQAELARQAEEARRQDEVRRLEAARKAELARQEAEKAKRENEEAERRGRAEEKRKADERAAAERKAEEARLAEERRKAEELRREDERKAAEAKARTEDEKRAAESRIREMTERAVKAFASGKTDEGRSLMESGNADDPRLLYWRGVCAEKGHGEKADESKAAKLYGEASELGNSDAQHRLGLMKFLGQSVEKNVAEAMVLNTKAAKQGNVGAQKFLAIQWEAGTVVPRSMAKAEHWYRKAAENGDAYAKKWLEMQGK